MEWIKTILEGATVTDGVLDVDALDAAISKAFPEHAVPKADFNAKVSALDAANKAVTEANKTIAELKKNNQDNEALQATIKEHEATIKQLQIEATNTAKTYALKDALTKAGVLDPDYLIYKAGGLDKFTFDAEGRPVGVSDVVKPYKADAAMAHLFKTEPGPGGYNPNAGGTPPTKNPFAKETFNLTEQGRLLRDNPEQARALAAAAGVTI